MAVLSSLNGYSGILWRSFLAMMRYVDTQLSTNLSTSATQTLVSACVTSLTNMRDSFDAYGYTQSWAQEYELLAPILTYSLGLDVPTSTLITNRINCFQSAAIAVSSIYSTTISNPSVMNTGNPTIVSPSLVEFLMNFGYETIPTDLIAGYPGSLLTDATAMATAWATTVTALATNGVVTGQIYDAASRQARVTQDISDFLSDLTISAASDPTVTWNRLVAMSALARTGSIYAADPTTNLSQQTAVARYVVCQTLDVMSNLLLKLRQYIPARLRVVTVLNTDTLVSIAARELGNFERWPEIATLNGLQPPYIGAIGATVTAGLATPGQQIFIPVDNVSSTSAPVTTTVPTYENNYLGVDLFLGPLSQDDMLPWTGDFNTQSGYDNLSTSLSRRIRTTLGALIFHPEYGSRIPPEVGNISDNNTSSYIESYAKSAINSDPRVSSVTNVSVAVPQYGVIEISATAIPNGSTATSTTVNEVLQPA